MMPQAPADIEGWTPQGDLGTPRPNRLAWPGFIALSCVIFELTANPSLALALGCVKFGWDDFRLARRLKRCDPDPVRGRVCARFTTACGLWKITMVATILMFVLVPTIPHPHRAKKARAAPGPEVPRTLVTATLLAIFGFGLSAATSTLAVVSAWRHRVKVWVGRRTNQAKTILSGALISMVALVCVSFCILDLMIGPAQGQPASLMVLASGGAFFLAPVALPFMLTALERRIVASHPGECWPVPLVIEYRGAQADSGTGAPRI
jgi:hypothetical protein